MFLNDMINNVRIELGDQGSTVWTDDDEVIRAILKSVSLLSRSMQKRNVVETTITRDIASETLTISSNTGTLANAPVEAGSLTITGKTLDTDYRINYLTGVVTEIGSNLPDTDYTAKYSTDPHMLDISSIVTDYIKIERVEYPAGDSPISLITHELFGDYMVFKSTTTLTEDKHLRIVYLSKWTPPTTTADGDYPSNLDNVVIIGASGQALIFKAETYTHTAISTLSTALTTLSGISAVTFPTAPTITTYLGDADTALDAAIARFAAAVATLGNLDTPLSDANIALDDTRTELGTAAGYLDSGDSEINTATRGEKVGSVFGEYASHGAAIADGYRKEAEQRIALALANEADAARDTTIGNSYVNEAIQRLTIAARELDSYEQDVRLSESKVGYYRSQIEVATQQIAVANQYLETSGRYLASGQSKINEFLAAIGLKPEFATTKASTGQRE